MRETAGLNVVGNAQWPFGIANRAAWVIPQKPHFPLPDDPTRFQTIAGSTTIALHADEAAIVLAALPENLKPWR
jgi:hypothetical protein